VLIGGKTPKFLRSDNSYGRLSMMRTDAVFVSQNFRNSGIARIWC